MLLDTHVLLWLLDDSPRLGPTTRGLLEGQSVHVSAASLWELAIKSALGKVRVPDDLPSLVEESGLVLVPIAPTHAWAVRDGSPLPHRDPFDAMMVAQAGLEGWRLVTADDQILGATDLGVDLVDARE